MYHTLYKKGENNEKQVNEKSIELFERKGFTQTSIQDIVDELGVTKGTFYYYFSSKEQLLMDIHLDYIVKLVERQEEIIDSPKLSNQEKITELIGLLINEIEKNGDKGRVFFREIRHLTKENIATIKEKRNQIRLNIEYVIKEGISSGEFHPDTKIDIVAFAILGLTNYSYQWFDPSGEVSADELIEIYSQVVFNGILSKQ